MYDVLILRWTACEFWSEVFFLGGGGGGGATGEKRVADFDSE